jgi:hypothetical protein
MGNADLLRRLRADAVARGLCMSCRARQPRAGVKTCDVCLDRKRDRKRDFGNCPGLSRTRGPSAQLHSLHLHCGHPPEDFVDEETALDG